MKRLLLLLMVTGLLKGVLVKADTNLATIQTIQNGFATVKECQKNTEDCTMDNSHTLKSVLELATVNECVASLEDYEKAGIDVPQCPKDMDDLKSVFLIC